MNALVTGGARGIEIARAFAHYDLAFGAAPSLDILVNNAGIGRGDRDASLQSGSKELFDEIMMVNAKGPYLVTHVALARLRDNGRIVNIGSISGKVGQAFAAGYAMSKRALPKQRRWAGWDSRMTLLAPS